MKALIFDVQRGSFVDGPGIRTTVFFKGCNLKCKWCHNPESQSPKKQILFYKQKCNGCGTCKKVCPTALESCDFCGNCELFCPSSAREICGKTYTVAENYDEIAKDKEYYRTSCGGVTFSGGECMLQIDFLCEILKMCKENGIHTAVDTAGHIPWESFEKILPFTDLFLYDIKAMNDEIHKEYTGVTNTCILENLKKLLKSNVDVWVRIPIIPDVNDKEEEMKNVKAFFDINGYPEKIELLPYHMMGEHKYTALGRTTQKFEVPDKEKIEKLKNVVVPY